MSDYFHDRDEMKHVEIPKLEQRIATLEAELATVKHERELIQDANTDFATENDRLTKERDNYAANCEHWKLRAVKAEAERGDLRGVLKLAEHSGEFGSCPFCGSDPSHHAQTCELFSDLAKGQAGASEPSPRSEG